jgi:hypothetical protein
MLADIDKEPTEQITYDEFVALTAHKMPDRDSREEIMKVSAPQHSTNKSHDFHDSVIAAPLQCT